MIGSQHRYSTLAGLLVACAGCSTGAETDLAVSELGQKTAGLEATDELSVVGQLRSREHTIIIYAGATEPRFTVQGKDGTVIAAALTGDEMRERHPAIYQTYRSTFARNNHFLDAGVDASARPPQFPSGPLVDYNDLPARR